MHRRPRHGAEDPLRRAARPASHGRWSARATAPTTSPSAAIFVHLHPALLATAAAPIAGRDAVYQLGREPDRAAFALRQDGRVVGHLPWYHQELVAALDHLDALAPSPRALAAVLVAAGASAVRRVGALLAGRSA